MRKYLLTVLMVVATCGMIAADFAIKKSTENYVLSLNEPLDSAGVPLIPDSAHIVTYADNATAATYSARSTTYPFSDISIDTIKNYGDTTYKFVDAIADIDGAGGNFLLDIEVILFADGLPTSTHGAVQIIDDSLNEFGWSPTRDATLKSLTIINNAGTAVTFGSSGGNGIGLDVYGFGSGNAATFTSGATGDALDLISAQGNALYAEAGAGSDAVYLASVSSGGGAGLKVENNFAGVPALVIDNRAGGAELQSKEIDSLLARSQYTIDSLQAALDSIQLYLDVAISSRSSLVSTDNIGINWGDITNPFSSAPDVNIASADASSMGVDDFEDQYWDTIPKTVWDPDTSGFSIAGSMGILMDARISSAGGVASISDADMAAIADSVWLKAVRTLTVADWVVISDSVLLANRAEISAEITDAVWDELLTAATHNIATSAGRRLRDITDDVIRSGTAQGPGTGTNQIQLDAGASAVSGTYDPSVISLVEGTTGGGQARMILEYDGATKTATLNRDWKILPTSATEFIIKSDPGFLSVNEGLAQAGSGNTITLNSLASASNDVYIDQGVFLVSGTGADQVGRVTDYVGATKVATIDKTWVTNPNTTTAYVMIPFVDGSASEIMDSLRGEPVITVPADTTESGDSTMTKEIYVNMPVSDTTANTFLSQLIRQVNLNVFQVDSLQMYLGYNSTNSRSVNGLDTETDTLHIYEGVTEIRRLLFWHIGGAEGDAPDSVTVAL